MPLTFPAHQLPVLPLKLWRPQWSDATALCVAAAVPDLAYPLGMWMRAESHTAIGLVIWALPVTLLACTLLRWRGAAGIFAQMPDLGVFRLHSYRVLGTRRPRVITTLISTLIGASTHMFIDGFTHTGRWGANWAGFNTVIGSIPMQEQLTIAKVLQYTGHTAGSVAALCVFALIGHRRLLEEWYGEPAVTGARSFTVTVRRRVIFWTAAALPVVGAAALCLATGTNPIFPVLLAAFVGLLAGGCVAA